MNRPPPPSPTGHAAPQPVPCLTKRIHNYDLSTVDRYTPSWVDVLRRCHYPEEVVVLDFESYFSKEYGLKSLSTPEYIQDPRWEVLGLAYLPMTAGYPFAEYQSKVAFKAGEQAVENYLRYLQITYGEHLERCTLVMQNAFFDAEVLALRYNIFPRYVIDTLCLARAYKARDKHGLDHLATEWGLPAKGDTQEFAGLSRRWRSEASKPKRGKPQPPVRVPPMTEDQGIALARYAENDACREWELFTILLPRLSNPASELRLMQLTLEMVTKPVIVYDRELGEHIIADMEQKKQDALNACGATADEVSGNNAFDALLTTALEAVDDVPQRYMKVTAKSGWQYELAKADPGLQRLLHHSDAQVRSLVEARQIVKSLPLHLARVSRMASVAKVCGGLLPIPLQFDGAHTGRDTGTWYNPQNLGRQGEGAVLRGLLKAPEGHMLVVSDLSAIEARVSAWLSGQADLVEAFTHGADVYCKFGSAFYGVPVRKPAKDEIPAIAKRQIARRQFAKICILGMSYGMGAVRFAEFACVDTPTAEKAVRFYRDAYPAITGFWYAIEKAFVYTAKYKAPCAMGRGLRFHSTDKIDVVMTLPSGRELNYHQVKVDGDGLAVYNPLMKAWERTWGGSLTENCVQAIARDILFESVLRIEDLGHRVAHRVHDELVLVAKAEEAQDVLAVAIREMSRTPVWAPGLPLNAEGVTSDRYGLH